MFQMSTAYLSQQSNCNESHLLPMNNGRWCSRDNFCLVLQISDFLYFLNKIQCNLTFCEICWTCQQHISHIPWTGSHGTSRHSIDLLNHSWKISASTLLLVCNPFKKHCQKTHNNHIWNVSNFFNSIFFNDFHWFSMTFPGKMPLY